jgi:polyhydroxyalkanoate synthesis regulator protein
VVERRSDKLLKIGTSDRFYYNERYSSYSTLQEVLTMVASGKDAFDPYGRY